MARSYRTILRSFIVTLFAAAWFAFPSAAQQPDTSKLAAEIAVFLTNSRNLPAPADGGKRRVVVVPLARDGKTTQFGAALAVDIALGLAQVSPELVVVDAETVRAEAAMSGLWPEDLATETIACWLAEAHGSNYAVTGTFAGRRDQVRITVKGVPCAKGMRSFRVRADLAAPKEALDRLSRDHVFPGVVIPVQKPVDDMTVGAQAGKDGIGSPSCRRCPDPSFTLAARANDTQGVVILRLIVTPEGRAAKVRLVRGLPDGLSTEAIRVVSRWEFEPARDAQGKAVPAWVTVEVVFRRL